jgi:hypothetical protein
MFLKDLAQRATPATEAMAAVMKGKCGLFLS